MLLNIILTHSLFLELIRADEYLFPFANSKINRYLTRTCVWIKGQSVPQCYSNKETQNSPKSEDQKALQGLFHMQHIYNLGNGKVDRLQEVNEGENNGDQAVQFGDLISERNYYKMLSDKLLEDQQSSKILRLHTSGRRSQHASGGGAHPSRRSSRWAGCPMRGSNANKAPPTAQPDADHRNFDIEPAEHHDRNFDDIEEVDPPPTYS